MSQVSRFGKTIALLTFRVGSNPADEVEQIPDDGPEDKGALESTVIEVARQVDVVSPVSDLALGITPVVFGSGTNWTNVANLTDGDDTTTFASGPNYVEPSTIDKGFSIDLGAPAAVSDMSLIMHPYSPALDYHIESSPDNSTWTDRPFTRTNVSSTYTYHLTGGPFTFRYWRVRRSYHGFIGPQRIYTWSIAGSTTTSSDKTWFGTDLVNDGDDATYEPSDGVDEVLRALFDIDQRLARVRMLVGSEISGSVTYELQHATALDFSDAATDATVTLTSAGSYTGDEVVFTWTPTAAYSLWQVVSSADENRRFYTFEAYAADLAGGTELVVAEDGVTVVSPADGGLDFRHGLDVTAPGGGVARVAVDEAEFTYGSVTAQTSFGLSSANGSAGTPAHSDHTHGTPAGNLEDLAAASTDATKVFAPDGAGGIIARDETAVSGVLFNTDGEEHVIQSHGSMGATETFDLVDGNVHQGTLDAATAITLTGFTAGKRCVLQAKLTEDGTGGHTPTFACAGTIVWIGGSSPTQDTSAGTVSEYLFWSDDGGTTVYGGLLGGGGGADVDTPALTFSTVNAAGAATTAVGTGATIALFDATVPTTAVFADAAATGSAGTAARRDHRHGMPAQPSGTTGEILVSDTPAGSPLVFSDLLQNEAGTDLLYADTV